jgi:hypothetical protein
MTPSESGGSELPWWLAGIYSAVAIAAAIWFARRADAACVIAEDSGVTVRNFRTTTHLAWDEIEDIGLKRDGHTHVILTTKDGREIRPYDMNFGPKFAAGSIPRIAAELASELESRRHPN